MSHFLSSIIFLLLHIQLQLRTICCQRVSKPNIVVILTDDQDRLLGSIESMKQLQKHIIDQGIDLTNAFVTTPVCCPSRSSFLTGKYAHNHNVRTNQFNCSSEDWRAEHEPFTFGKLLQDQGYRTAYVGKYLNKYNGLHVPVGWTKWFGLVKNSKFYNYSVNNDGVLEKFGNSYSKDYFTDVVTNVSLSLIHFWKMYYPKDPFLLVMSYPAPHGPEDSAPQYQHLFENNTQHHTKAYNFAPNPDKEWLLRHTGKMPRLHKQLTDILQQKRLQTLQSVDTAIARLVQQMTQLKLLDSSYIFYTSDHGYHLGQFGLLKGKTTPYEFDIRVPLFVRGPAIKPKSKSLLPVLNVDLLPTLLDLANVALPSGLEVDGRSYKNILFGKSLLWRNSFLLERGRITPKQLGLRNLKQNAINHKYNDECTVEDAFFLSCQEGDSHECVQSDTNSFQYLMQSCAIDNEEPPKAKRCRCKRSLMIPVSDYVWKSCWSGVSGAVECSYARLADWLQDRKMMKLTQKKLDEIQGQLNILRQAMRRNKQLLLQKHECKCIKDKNTLHINVRRKKFFKKRETKATCNLKYMNCFLHDRNHWKTPPYWNESAICFCGNANNYTYWCLRTVNSTHNILYCEFVTGFTSYYDLTQDPDQLTNQISNVSAEVRDELHKTVTALKTCSATSCNFDLTKKDSLSD